MLKPSLEIISESFHLYLKNFRALLPYLLVMFLPYLILAALGILFSYLEVFLESSRFLTISANLIILILFIIEIIVAYWWVPTAMTRSLQAGLSGQIVDWKENLRTSKRLIVPLFLTSLLLGLIMLSLVLLPTAALTLLTFWPNFITSMLVAPLIVAALILTIIFRIWYGFYLFPVMLEGVKYVKALNASKALIFGRGWKIAWRFLIFDLAFAIISVVPLLLISYIVPAIPIATFLQLTLKSLLETGSVIILVPLYISMLLILYINAKENPITSEVSPVPINK